MNRILPGSLLLLCLIHISCTRPIAVTHWDAKEKGIVRKTIKLGRDVYGYPVHTKLSAIVCLNETCINRQESINFNKKYRFKGYKNNKPPERESPQKIFETEPVIASESEKQPSPKPDINQTQVFRYVYFETGKARLKPESTAELDQLLSLLEQNSKLKIIVSGHTDNTGDKKSNVKLSQLRADAVIEYLAEKGIAKHRLSAKGYGSSRPVTSNASQEGRNQNRRVEFLITDTGK
ncbi:OmpA family protein [Rhodocytophaga rosea]|uniref:OmpA family protein n=1 Tax=Rhodocytophaga rosea TaxID=2704465 RepID=A0A6C0GTW7_9BACT|nr:OmpA family protein [Rhodocytophaga rosea]QHT70993.1 OmpA family protein [Rhodocytophaga rosea]